MGSAARTRTPPVASTATAKAPSTSGSKAKTQTPRPQRGNRERVGLASLCIPQHAGECTTPVTDVSRFTTQDKTGRQLPAFLPLLSSSFLFLPLSARPPCRRAPSQTAG